MHRVFAYQNAIGCVGWGRAVAIIAFLLRLIVI